MMAYLMNNTFKQVLPALEEGSPAEAYLYSVRKEAQELSSVFYTQQRDAKPKLPRNASPGRQSSQQVNLYLVHKKCSQIFQNLPCRAADPVEFWQLAHKEVAALEPIDLDLSGKEAWKSYINNNDPTRLAHQQIFAALKVLSKLPPSDHSRWWAWCLLLQIPKLVTATELALMRSFTQEPYQDAFYSAVLGECFGQKDLTFKRQKLDY